MPMMTFTFVLDQTRRQLNTPQDGNSKFKRNSYDFFFKFHSKKQYFIFLFSIPGKLKWISAGKNEVFGVNADNKVFYFSRNLPNTPHCPTFSPCNGDISFEWRSYHGSVTQICAYDQ